MAALIALVAFGGCPAKRRDLPLAPRLEVDPEAPLLTGVVGFDWNPGCVLPVRYKNVAGGETTSGAFDVHVTADLDETLLIELRNVRDLMVDGRPATKAREDRSVARTTAMAWRVDNRGGFVGTVDLRAYFRAIRDTSATGWTDADIDALVSDPVREHLVETGMAATWQTWVADWIGTELPDSTDPGTFDASPDGMAKPHVWVFENLGSVVGAPRLALLRSTRTNAYSASEAAALLPLKVALSSDARLEAGRALAATFSRASLIAVDTSWDSLEVNTTSTVAMDVARGRPHRVREVIETVIDGKTVVESSDTAFDWAHSKGCK